VRYVLDPMVRSSHLKYIFHPHSGPSAFVQSRTELTNSTIRVDRNPQGFEAGAEKPDGRSNLPAFGHALGAVPFSLGLYLVPMKPHRSQVLRVDPPSGGDLNQPRRNSGSVFASSSKYTLNFMKHTCYRVTTMCLFLCPVEPSMSRQRLSVNRRR